MKLLKFNMLFMLVSCFCTVSIAMYDNGGFNSPYIDDELDGNTLVLDPADAPEDDGSRLVRKPRKKNLPKAPVAAADKEREKKIEPARALDKQQEKSELSFVELLGLGFGGTLLAGIIYILFFKDAQKHKLTK